MPPICRPAAFFIFASRIIAVTVACAFGKILGACEFAVPIADKEFGIPPGIAAIMNPVGVVFIDFGLIRVACFTHHVAVVLATDAVPVQADRAFHACAVAAWAVTIFAWARQIDAFAIVARFAECAWAFAAWARFCFADPVAAKLPAVAVFFACILRGICPRKLIINLVFGMSRRVARTCEHAFADADAFGQLLHVSSDIEFTLFYDLPAFVCAFHVVAVFERETVACVGFACIAFFYFSAVAVAILFDADPRAVVDIACEPFQARDISARAALYAVFRHICAEWVWRAVIFAAVRVHAAPEAVSACPVRRIREFDGGFSAHAVVVRLRAVFAFCGGRVLDLRRCVVCIGLFFGLRYLCRLLFGLLRILMAIAAGGAQ